MRFAEDWIRCNQIGMDQETFHRIHLQLNGLSFPNKSMVSKSVYVDIPYEYSLREYVPRKIPVSDIDETPYYYDGDTILFLPSGKKVFNDRVIRVHTPISDQEKYSNGFTFPFLKTTTPFYELRINPKNTGQCPGRCVFCHRETSYRQGSLNISPLIPVDTIIRSIIDQHGEDSLKLINHVSVITELFGCEDTFLDYIDELKTKLFRYVGVDCSFRACALDVQTKSGLKRLKNLVDDNKYSFSLESFTNRERIMSRYKGIPLENVENLLYNAREVGFDFIKLNYIAGIDSIEDFCYYIKKFKGNNLVDMLGLSVFTAFTKGQKKIRNPYAWSASYYDNLVSALAEIGISIYEPHCFDMGFPEALINKCNIVYSINP
ncbi:MAG: radical SAM protein [Oscillospiraceae bacterium]|nr:radical SAM protein [Oscillospiraceae bacterium]